MGSRLKSFRIGRVRIDFPVVLGGLAGYSDLAYRLICRACGAPYCTTEVMLAKSVLVTGKLRKRLLRLDVADHPIAGQVMGNSPETMAAAGAVLCEEGFDVIDLNFACPVRKALTRRRGGYLLKDPALAVSITRAVLAAVDRPVTLKLRRGFAGGGTDDAFMHIATEAFAAGAAGICVHGRSVEAGYTGGADWEFLASVKQRFADRTVIGSGDVLTPSDAVRMLEQTGVDAAAVARGAMGNPWFFRHVRDLAAGLTPRRPSLAEQCALLAKHFTDACVLYGTRRGPRNMRKFGIKYARLHPRPRDVRAAFVAVKRAEDFQRVLDDFYAGD